MIGTGGFEQKLHKHSFTWLVTGAAGFIGSHLVQKLLELRQKVVGLDNYSTGSPDNLTDIESLTDSDKWRNFRFIEGDIRDLKTCRDACQGVDFVLHHAALGSVPMSIEDPLLTHHVNVSGFVNMMLAAKDANVRRMVYASSCAVYGDNSQLPLTEIEQPRPISPYAASKVANELYAQAFSNTYGFPTVGLRYFNVFGERQDPNGHYAAVIPKWINSILRDESLYIYGDGQNTRDFVYVEDVVQANIKASLSQREVIGSVYNVAAGHSTSLIQLYQILAEQMVAFGVGVPSQAKFGQPRTGDIRHSQGCIACLQEEFGYQVTELATGLKRTVAWFVSQHKKRTWHKAAPSQPIVRSTFQ